MKKGFTPLENFTKESFYKKGRNQKFLTGFTFLEIMIAISVMTIGILAVYTLIPKMISISSANINRFIASQLAREGMEIVRNIRDTNWLEEVAWDAGLADGDWRIQYNKDYLFSLVDEFLKRDINGFYNYDSGEETKFKRKITLSHFATTTLNVKVEVSWPGSYSPFQVEENLYNWR